MMLLSDQQQHDHVGLSIIEAPVPDIEGGRRAFIRALGLGAIGTAIVASTGIVPAASQTAPSDTDILNFALNFEYLGAEFYLRASVGQGLTDGEISGTGRLGPVAGGRQVGFATDYIRNFANELAVDERGHVQTLRRALGSAAIARPAIDLGTAFSQAAFGAGLVPAGGTFDPFANENNFLQAAFLFEDVCVTALAGAAPLLQSKANLATAAGFLAVESYQAGALRLLLSARGFGAQTVAISDARDRLDGPGDDDQGAVMNGVSNLTPTDATGLAFARTPQQVLQIAYLNTNRTPAGFFPNGVNGNIQ